MIKKIQTWIRRKQQERTNHKKMKQMQEYYKLVHSGSLFLQYIRQDLEKQKKKQINRHMRRRFEKKLHTKGEFTEEIIRYYDSQIEDILKYIDKQLNPPKPGEVTIQKTEKKSDAK